MSRPNLLIPIDVCGRMIPVSPRTKLFGFEECKIKTFARSAIRTGVQIAFLNKHRKTSKKDFVRSATGKAFEMKMKIRGVVSIEG